MRRFLLMGMTLLWAAPLPAGTTATVTETGDSLSFSTKPGAEYAWELTRSGNEWTLSFAPNAVVVDNSCPTDTTLQGDYVQLPTMTVTGVADRGDFLVATLNPSQPLTINSRTDSSAVLTAAMESGGMLAIGTTTVAYSQQEDDLTIESSSKDYGVVIPALAADQGNGLLLDLSFSGNAIRGGNLFNTLRSDSGTVRGTLSGQISSIRVIPEPATLLLLGLGTILAARFGSRARR
jgi:hypothetical protein